MHFLFYCLRSYSLYAMSVWLLTSFNTACAQQITWQDEQRKAISLADRNVAAAVAMYRQAIASATTAGAPIEKQLGLLLQCGDLLYSSYRVSEAQEIYTEGIKLAHSHDLKNWEARFLLMSSCAAHMLLSWVWSMLMIQH